MARVKIIFCGSQQSNSSDSELECFVNTKDEIYISIDNKNGCFSWLCLDKPTAIKFAKTLRTEINKI